MSVGDVPWARHVNKSVRYCVSYTRNRNLHRNRYRLNKFPRLSSSPRPLFGIHHSRSSTLRPIICDSSVTRMATITLVLGWNVFIIDLMNNVHPTSFLCDAWTCIPRAQSNPELTWLDLALHNIAASCCVDNSSVRS